MLTKVLSTSIIAGLFLIGCGGTEATTTTDTVVDMPHQVDMTPKSSREFDPEGEEYLHFMKSYNLNSRVFTISNSYRSTALNIPTAQNPNLKYAFYYDTDHNKNTGYYDKWVPNAGADYLVENNILFKYTGTPGSHEWSWEAKGYVGQGHDNVLTHYWNVLQHHVMGYGIALNPDYTQNSFLGYYDTNSPYLEKKVALEGAVNREFTVSKDDEDVYLHSYRKNKHKLNNNEIYYNYQFSINGINYETQGNTLVNDAGEIVTYNLIYEVREYDTVTIIPKRYLANGDIDIKSITIRDNDWNELASFKSTDILKLKQMIANGEDVTNFDTSNIRDMSSLFYHNENFNQDISGWDVSNVTNMSKMFKAAKSFNQDISNWDVSNVTDMNYMFADASKFNQPIGNWNVSNVTNMNYMFSYASKFNQPIGDWNLFNVKSMTAMFQMANNFNQDIGSWDVSNVTHMNYIFNSATKFNQDIGNWNVSNVTNMYEMFFGAINFDQDIGNWNVSNATNMARMFHAAKAFSQDISRWNVQNATTMWLMFYQTKNFNHDISNWNVQNVVNFSSFNGKSILEDQNIPAKFR